MEEIKGKIKQEKIKEKKRKKIKNKKNESKKWKAIFRQLEREEREREIFIFLSFTSL